jgi:hypothetical protein
MTVPATTGSLKTNVSDMQIGDYIVCKYVATNDAVGVFSDLGTSVENEVPILGSATPNGIVYLIKIAKGLLAADRHVQVGISWDTLNSGKYIQGLQWDNTSTPIMTSLSTPSGVVNADTYALGYEPWRAFDGLTTTAWASTTLSHGWLSYNFGKQMSIFKYEITGSGAVGESPKNWTLEGSNDGSTWEVLDTQNNIIFTSGEAKQFTLNKYVNYNIVRLNVTATGGSLRVALRLLKIFNYSGIIRSFSGGGAYNDANGDKSLTNQSKGAWPTNNEWDKYILGFPSDMIKSGKTTNDVFNLVSNLVSWCQDTPLNGITHPLSAYGGGPNPSNNTGRIYRGPLNYLTVNTDFSWATSNWAGLWNSSINQGFRPLFEFREV